MTRILSIAILAVLNSSVFADTPAPTTAASADLVQMYQQALERDPGLSAAKYKLEAGKEKVVQGKSRLLPNVAASASVSYQFLDSRYSNGDNLPPNRSSADPQTQIGVEMRHPLYNKTANVSYEQSKLVADQAEIQFQQSQQDLILKVAEPYFGILSAQQSVAVAQAQRAAFSESLDRANLAFKIGTANITDKLEAQARFDLARASEIDASNALEIAKQSLKVVVGELPPALRGVPENAPLPPLEPKDVNSWTELALQHNIQLRSAISGSEIAQQEVERRKSDKMPTIDLVASAGNNFAHSSLLDANTITTSLSAGVRFAMPLYTGGGMESLVREASSNREEARQRVQEAQRQVIYQTQQAFLRAQSGNLRIEALKQAVASNQSALDATKKGLEVGIRTNLDVLNAQQQFFSTKRDLVVARHEFLLNILKLRAASGSLNDEHVAALNSLLTK